MKDVKQGLVFLLNLPVRSYQVLTGFFKIQNKSFKTYFQTEIYFIKFRKYRERGKKTVKYSTMITFGVPTEK